MKYLFVRAHCYPLCELLTIPWRTRLAEMTPNIDIPSSYRKRGREEGMEEKRIVEMVVDFPNRGKTPILK